MRVLVLGKSGMLGRDVMDTFLEREFNVLGIDRKELDLEYPSRIPRVLKNADPDIVINCAAYTNVDLAEKEREKAMRINRDSPGVLAETCNAFGIPLIHVSTDYVFDGRSSRPYKENDPVCPVNYYGLTKKEGEDAIRSNLEKHIIVRTSWLYGRHGKNFVKTILRLAAERSEIRVVADQFGSPTWAVELARALLKVVETIWRTENKAPWGTYHFAGLGETSWYKFAEEIVNRAKKYQDLTVRRVVPISTDQYPTPATRPGRSTLDSTKISETFGVTLTPWEESLSLMIKEYYDENL